MSKQASPTTVGVFVVAALALALAAVVVLAGGRWFHDTARVVVFFDDSVNGLEVGAPVKFRGIAIGRVADIRINITGAMRDPAHIRIPVILEIDLDRLTAEGVADVDLREPAEVQRMIDGGLRAELATESMVTGVRYIALDIRPGTPANLVDADLDYPQLPSVRGKFAQLPDRAERVLERLAEVDYAGIARSLQATTDDARALLRSPHLERTLAGANELTQKLNRTVGNLDLAVRGLVPIITDIRDAAKSTGRAIAPDGRIANQLAQTLDEMSAAARAMRRLAEHVDRDPGSLLRGGEQ